jgi:acyl-CoA thioester hydrolase
MPTAEQVQELPAQIRMAVPQEYLDGNGHMTTLRYVATAAEAMGLLWTDVGMGWEHHHRHGRSGFMLEQHLRYLGELVEGETFSAHARLLDRSDKVLHSMVFLLDEAGGRVAFTAELVAICMDLESRRPAAFPEDVAAALDRALARHRSLGWDAPAAGTLGIRPPRS